MIDLYYNNKKSQYIYVNKERDKFWISAGILPRSTIIRALLDPTVFLAGSTTAFYEEKEHNKNIIFVETITKETHPELFI